MSKADQIRTLNDQLRQNLGTGVATAVITVGVATLGDEAVSALPPKADISRFQFSGAERGKGLAGALFQVLQTHMAGRPAMTFIRADNIASLRAHQKMGMSELGPFVSEDLSYIALSYTG